MGGAAGLIRGTPADRELKFSGWAWRRGRTEVSSAAGRSSGRVWFGCSLGVDVCTACVRCPCRPHWVPCGRPLAPTWPRARSTHAPASPRGRARGAWARAQSVLGLAGGIDRAGPFALALPSDGERPLVKAVPLVTLRWPAGQAPKEVQASTYMSLCQPGRRKRTAQGSPQSCSLISFWGL